MHVTFSQQNDFNEFTNQFHYEIGIHILFYLVTTEKKSHDQGTCLSFIHSNKCTCHTSFVHNEQLIILMANKTECLPELKIFNVRSTLPLLAAVAIADTRTADNSIELPLIQSITSCVHAFS